MKYTRLKNFTWILVAVSAAWVTLSFTWKGEASYLNNATEELVQKMIKAHGGMDTWRNAPSISYTHDMIDPKKPDDHWLSEEIHEQGRRRCYQKWTADEAVLANTGDEIWTLDWKRANPPTMMAGVSYFFINMVWMTVDDAANLEQKEDTQVDSIEKGKFFHTVRLTFTGSSPYEYFDMYIDKDSYMLRGVKYTVTHKDLFKAFGMPADTKFMGPLLKVYKEYANVDGLKMTSRYDTYKPNGQNYGIHTVTDYSLKKEFEADKLQKPIDGIIFESDM